MKKFLLLMSVFFLALSFTACSDDDEPNPEPQPENKFVLDGANKTIEFAIIDKVKFDQDIYVLKIQTSDEFELEIQATKDLHDGKVIDLTIPENVSGSWCWAIKLLKFSGHPLFVSYGHPKVACKRFSSGTLFIRRLANDDKGWPIFEVKIQNAKIKDDINGDNKEHTLDFYWKGGLEYLA